MYLKVLILLLILITAVFFVLSKKEEKFDIERDCGLFYEHTLPTDAKTYLKFIVTKALEGLNKNQEKCFSATNLDRVAMKQEEDGTMHYNIHYFVSEWDGNVNRKLIFDIVVDEVTGIMTVNDINDGASLDPLLPRQKEPERQSILFKPESKIIVKGAVSDSNLEHSDFPEEYNSGEKKDLLERNKTLPTPDRKDVNEDSIYPMRMKLPKWDTVGIPETDEGSTLPSKCMKGGIFHGVNKKDKIIAPTYNPTLFFGHDTNHDWLFSLSEDAASRPVGIA